MKNLKQSIWAVMSVIGLLFAITACSEMVAPTYEMTPEMSQKPEVQRLRFFREINFNNTPELLDISGRGVRITIMGEMVDASHPDLNKRVKKQYFASVEQNKVIPGFKNQPYKFEEMGHGDGHGTHIAGTIAAECDGIGIQGIACHAQLDAYDLDAYGSEEEFMEQNVQDSGESFLTAFTLALQDVTRRGNSKITTGSFNFESPFIRYKNGGPLEGLTVSQMVSTVEKRLNDVDDFFAEHELFEFEDVSDKKYLREVYSKNGEDENIVLMTLLVKSKQWSELEGAISDYQESGGVYIITESNYIFGRTSLLNAMPSLSNKVDKDLWLSVVMVQPDKIDEATSKDEFENILQQGHYITPINICGQTAKDYCIVTPSYDVFSTMTEKVRELASPLFSLEGRFYQAFSGHSMGAPMVAGTLALMQEYNTKKSFNYSMKDLVKILKNSANRKFEGYDPIKHGRGMLDISAALEMMNNGKQ